MATEENNLEISIEDMLRNIEYVIGVHKMLHGQKIFRYAIVDDVLRKHRGYNRETVEKIVNSLLD